jgi:prevent-host-death family protein
MRFVNVRELKSKTSEILRAAAGEDIIVTNHGKPVAVVAGIDGRDFEKIGFCSGASRVREIHAPYRSKAADYEKPEAGGPAQAPAPAEKPAWNPLKAVFWDYPDLTDEATLGLRIQEARNSPIQDAFRWYLARFLERGRVVDAWRFFRLDEIRRIMPSLRISSRAVAKWTRILEYYGNP